MNVLVKFSEIFINLYICKIKVLFSTKNDQQKLWNSLIDVFISYCIRFARQCDSIDTILNESKKENRRYNNNIAFSETCESISCHHRVLLCLYYPFEFNMYYQIRGGFSTKIWYGRTRLVLSSIFSV